jgi:ubiquinone/menaquinone biosynthesis C-methylase UbiE
MGYSDEDAYRHDKAVIRMIRELALRARITRYDAVVDLGCGIGGSAIWLAENIGCMVIGVDINSHSISIAEAEVKKRGLGGLATFFQSDFECLPLASGIMDVAWFLESLCYAPDKYAVLREVARVLAPRGRIVIADGFKVTEGEELDIWLRGWAVPNLATVSQFKFWLKSLGFSKITYEDITARVLPSIERLYRYAKNLYPVGKIMERLTIRTPVETGNILGAINIYKSVIKGQCRYGIFLAEKGV